jgi:glycosyltransferase involved in cell wall biosynthesis
MARPRVAIVHQGFIPEYRVRFFELLADRSEIEYVVFHGQAPTGSGHRAAAGPFGFPNVAVQNREVVLGGKRIILQPILGRIARGSYAAAVLGAELKFVANVAVAGLMSAWGKPVVLWGHGYEKDEDAPASLLTRTAAGLKRRYARGAAGYLVYTEGGAARLTAAGVDPARVTVVRNTLDMSRQQALRSQLERADPSVLRRELGVDPQVDVLLYVGRIYSEKRVEELVELARRLHARPEPACRAEIVVVGDGPDRRRVEALARGIPGIRFVGELYDEGVARWLHIATAVVMPGKVGLTVNHALAHGIPVLTRNSRLHAPEIEYLRHGHNGLVVKGDLDAYEEAVAEVLLSPSLSRRLRNGALESRHALGLDQMVAAFSRGVAQVVARN